MTHSHHIEILADEVWPKILPRCIFAAGRQSFRVTAFFDLEPDEILDAAFEILPLTEYGWSRNRCTARHRDKNIWTIARI